MANDEDFRRMADIALALEHELQKTRERLRIADGTIEMLTDEIEKAARRIVQLEREIGK